MFYRSLLVVLALAVRFPNTRADSPGGVTTESALRADPTGWVDLLSDRGPDLRGWSRGPIPPKGPLGPVVPSQWSLDPKTGHLVCRGDGGHEWLRWNEQLADGVFHVEWRFKPVPGKSGYNSGVYARNSADATIWHQAQTGGGNGGYLFGETLVDGALKRVNLSKEKKKNRENAPGEWNTFEMTFQGDELILWVNGAVVNVWKNCGTKRGYVGLEAEGYEIEFRNVKLKTLAPGPDRLPK